MRRVVPAPPAALRGGLALLALGIVVTAVCSAAPPAAGPAPDEAQLRAMTARFAPVDIGADVSSLPEGERRALAKLVEAARVMDALFLRQVWAGNEALLLELLDDRSPLGQARLALLPDQQGPVVAARPRRAVRPRRAGQAGGRQLLPGGRDEGRGRGVDEGACPRRSATPRTGFFTTIRRGAGRQARRRALQRRVPGRARARGGAAARGGGRDHRSRRSRRFLETRADAFLSNDYYASDVAWMELDASHRADDRPVRGRTRTSWFNYKAAFEAFITVRDDAETAKLARFGAELQELEDHLPIDPALRNPKLGGAGADPRRERRLLRRRRQPRRADGGLQPAERRARRRARRAASA